MNKTTKKELEKLTDELEMIIPLLESGDSEGRYNYIKFRHRVVNIFGLETFSEVCYLTNVRLYGKETSYYS